MHAGPESEEARWSEDPVSGRVGYKDEEAQLLGSDSVEQLDYDEGYNDAGYEEGEEALQIRSVGPVNFLRSWNLGQLLDGSRPPGTLTIKPILQTIQEAPLRFIDRHFPRTLQKASLLALFLCCWAIAFAVPLVLSNGGGDDGSGRPVRRLACTDTLWQRDSGCGLDGIDCGPFANTSSVFYCPAGCAAEMVLNPRAVGTKEVTYRPLVIGGPVYRGDSFVCSAALHAGVVSNSRGGCGIVERVGEHANFPILRQNGIESIEFNSYFPLSFEVLPADAPGVQCGATDSRGAILLVSLAFTALLSLCTASPPVLFFAVFVGVFAHVGLVSDPPSVSHAPLDAILPELVSVFAGRLLPALFCAVVLYRTCVKRALAGLTAQVEKTALWLGGFWVGGLSNTTLGWLPIQRLTPHDLAQQPGAEAALALILFILFLALLGQALGFRREGRLRRHLALCALLLAAIAAGASLPGLQLRLHHYVIALLLLPSTALQTRPSLLYQGFLLGLLVNGAARWGFDPILQTAAALREDAALGSPLPPFSHDPSIVLGIGAAGQPSNITFSWAAAAAFDGMSVLVNDVERYRDFFLAPARPVGNEGAKHGDGLTFTWTRHSANMPEYFRFAYVKDGGSLDYTKAGTWRMDGTWAPAEDAG